MSKRQSSNGKKNTDALWEKVCDLEHHFSDIAGDLIIQLSEGKIIHPESEEAIHAIKAHDNLMEATHDAIHAEGDCDCGD